MKKKQLKTKLRKPSKKRSIPNPTPQERKLVQIYNTYLILEKQLLEFLNSHNLDELNSATSEFTAIQQLHFLRDQYMKISRSRIQFANEEFIFLLADRDEIMNTQGLIYPFKKK